MSTSSEAPEGEAEPRGPPFPQLPVAKQITRSVSPDSPRTLGQHLSVGGLLGAGAMRASCEIFINRVILLEG